MIRYIKRRELFDSEVRRVLKGLGAKSDPTQNVPWSCYRLDTKAGPLILQVHTELFLRGKSWAHGKGWPWVSGRFSNVEAAVGLLGWENVNRFSGKWNHHCWNSWTDSFDYR